MGWAYGGGTILTVLEVARLIFDVIADHNGDDIVMLDIREMSDLADYFVICTVTGARQAGAVVEAVRAATKRQTDVRLPRIEGTSGSGWRLMDYGDVVVHLFTPEKRAYYRLENLWENGRVVVRML